MPRFSAASKFHLNSCHKDLQMLFNTVIHGFDCSVICGRRGELAQNQAFADGKSKVTYPNSKHNTTPSMAADVTPWPCDWGDKESFIYFGGVVMATAALLHYEGFMSHRLRWGGHFDGFFDGAHFELIGI